MAHQYPSKQASDDPPHWESHDLSDSTSSSEKASHDADEDPAPSPDSGYPEGGARAWSVAIGNAGAMFCTLGFVNSIGVFQAYYETHQLRDNSASSIAWIGSLQSFFIFAAGLIGGPMFDRWGAKVMWLPSATYVFSLMMTSLCNKYYQFMLSQGILGGISIGLIMSPAMAATPHYFQKKRGAAMGLAVAGSSLGGVIFPIALSRMFALPQLGFGWSVRICGFMVFTILTAACLAIKARLPPRKSQFLLPSAFKELPFVTVTAAFFFLLLGMFTPIFFLPSYAISQGMSEKLAFYLISILNGASFPGRVLPGILADKFGRFNMLFCSGLSTAILIFCWQRIKSNAAIIVFAGIFGFCSGAIISCSAVSLASTPKDPRNIGTYVGMGMAVGAIAALVGPPINGALVAHYGGFNQLADFSGAMCLAGCVLVVWAKQVTGLGLFTKG